MIVVSIIAVAVIVSIVLLASCGIEPPDIDLMF